MQRLPILALPALLLLAACAAPERGDPTSPAPASGPVGQVASDETAGEPAPRPLSGTASDASAAPKAQRAETAVAGMATVEDIMAMDRCCPGRWRQASEPLDRENYGPILSNPLRLAAEHPVSTFSIDVDTGAYSNVRRILNSGRLPPADAVRVEELINYFDYDYPAPPADGPPFSVSTELAAAPWHPERLLLQIGIRGRPVPDSDRKPANLVFLIDVSGSMESPAKLPLLQRSLALLTRQLTAADRVSLVVYAGAAGVVLEPTPGDRHARITSALERLTAGGSTNGAGGIRTAYAMARQAFLPDGINRILLATDGDFNVGTVDFDSLLDLIERERASGISLTTLGFGSGNYNDHLMEQLADAGDGNHAYIDSLSEGRKVLVEQLTGTLQTIARDVKIQVEFNPAVVAEYRLIGYENRQLNREDFNNDRVDAGEIGAGHTVTALYELSLVGSPARLIDPLRYAGEERPTTAGGELAFLKLRYKLPAGGRSRLLEQPIARPRGELPPASERLRFAAAVAAFGQLLRGGQYLGEFGYGDVAALAAAARGADPQGYRGEFLGLVRLAESLSPAAARSGSLDRERPAS